MDEQRKLKLTFVTIGLTFLLNGVEYAVILPTIWRYLQTFQAQPYFLGLTLSAFSLSGLLSGPLFGFWSDRTQTTKKVILLSVVFQIVGNILYFVGFSKWVLLSSRFVGGVGAGAGSSIFGFLTRVTAPADRATVFAAVMACRQAGLLIGPAFNIFLRLCDFKLGPFVVNKYTAPGLFMGVLWSLFQLVVVFMYWDLPPPQKRPNDCVESKRDVKHQQGGEDDEATSDEEEKPLIASRELVGSYGSLVAPKQDDSRASTSPVDAPNHLSPPPSPEAADSVETSSPFKNFSITREFLREEVVVLLAAQFVTLFNQTALETMVTPLTQKYFDFAELENSVMYFLGGAVIIASFVFVRWLSRSVKERVILAIGLGICNIACIWFLIFLVHPRGTFAWQLSQFIIGLFLQIVGLPFVAVAQVSLFSKVTSEKTQGFSQGVRRSVGGLATILGPLWAGSLTYNLYIMVGVMMGLLVLLSVMLGFSYNSLVEPAIEEETDNANSC